MSIVSTTPASSLWWQRTLWSLGLLLAAAVGTHICRYEGGAADIAFTIAAPATFGGLLLVATRRGFFSLIASIALVTLIFLISRAKQDTMNMVLHAYDIIFYFSSWSTISFLLESYPWHMVALAAGIVMAMSISWVAWRLDEGRVSRPAGVAIAGMFALLTAGAGHLRPPLHEATFFTDDRYVSAFFWSLRETVSVLARGNLVEAAAAATGGPFTGAISCDGTVSPPHVVLVHQESTVPPAHFAGLQYDRAGLDPFFQSYDGTRRKLRVETYAGASWLSEFSILAGMSTHAFGSMRPFVQSVMAGKLRDALPQILQKCGYRNVIVYPMLRNFVANDRFYAKIGIDQVIDAKDQKATRPNERDRFYYETGLNTIERRIGESGGPLFLYIQTQASHAQYDFTYEPDVKVAGGGPGTDPQVSEYLRRLGMAAMDYKYLKTELARRFPKERFLIVNYGDHQPDVTRRLLGPGFERGVLTMERHPAAFMTYYSVEGVGFTPLPLPQVETLDVPYLGTVILQAAGLPLPDTYRERLRLMSICKGRYHGCESRGEILAFHRRLLNSGLMDRL